MVVPLHPNLRRKNKKNADDKENVVSVETSQHSESTTPGDNQQATKVAAPTSGFGGGMHFSACNNITVNYYNADRK